MTLCIAASCQHKDDPALVLCSDTRALAYSQRTWEMVISSDDADKSRFVGDFAALVAGNPTQADLLIACWDEAVRKFSSLPDGGDTSLEIKPFFDNLREGSRFRKKEIQNHFLGMNSPFESREDFLKRGRDVLPKKQYGELWNEMRQLHLGAEIILAGFHHGESLIVKVGMDGEPHWVDQYAAIGAGSTDALAFLTQNDYDEFEMRLEDCLMRVVETLDFACTVNNTVGHNSRFEVHLLNGTEWDLKEKFFNVLKSRIRLSSPVELGDCGDFLEPIEDDVSLKDEQKAAKPADASNEQPSGAGAGNSESGDSAPSGGVSGNGPQQP